MIKNVYYSLNSELISNILLKLEIIYLITKEKIYLPESNDLYFCLNRLKLTRFFFNTHKCQPIVNIATLVYN